MSTESLKFYIRRNDTFPLLKVQVFRKSDCAFFNITNATAVFTMVNSETGIAKVINGAMTISNGAEGKLYYIWNVGETDTVGVYFGLIEITLLTGQKMTLPRKQRLEIYVNEDFNYA